MSLAAKHVECVSAFLCLLRKEILGCSLETNGASPPVLLVALYIRAAISPATVHLN